MHSKHWSYHEALGEALYEEPWPSELWQNMSTLELMRLAQDVAGELNKRQQAIEQFQQWIEEGSNEAWEDAA